MSKVLIDIEAKDLANIKDGDILVYNGEKRLFYKQTAQEFWAKHNNELAKIIKRYDELVKDLEQKIKVLESKEKEHEKSVQSIIVEHEEQEKEFEAKVKDYLTKNKNITNKLIEMVENFIKTGGNV